MLTNVPIHVLRSDFETFPRHWGIPRHRLAMHGTAMLVWMFADNKSRIKVVAIV